MKALSPSSQENEEQKGTPPTCFDEQEFKECRAESLEDQITRRADEKSRRQVGSPGQSLGNWLKAVREVLSEQPQG